MKRKISEKEHPRCAKIVSLKYLGCAVDIFCSLATDYVFSCIYFSGVRTLFISLFLLCVGDTILFKHSKNLIIGKDEYKNTINWFPILPCGN